MTRIWARQALTAEGWARDVTVTIDPAGRIASVEPASPRQGDHLTDILLPAPANGHSHAFQRAMAGMTEARGPDARDSFWTWRRLMYRFLDRLTPEDVEAIAALVQMEMLEAGYATCVEFHYLHHQPDGRPYDRLSEMSDRILAAAARTGIGLTLLPVMYQFGGCDGRGLGPGQVRFGNDPDRFAQLHAEATRGLADLPSDACMGVAAHSLRAVAPRDLPALAGLTAGPVHMHLAEQVAEVEEVTAHLGQRPVEWVLDHMPLDARYTLIHCTQMTPDETRGLARTGAVAGLCPITEANLGDGIFDGVRWFEAGGAMSIGSDSNVRISLTEELRLLDYGQRLRDRSRAALATDRQSTGRRLFEAAARGGALSAGRDCGTIAPGQWADVLSLDGGHIDLEAATDDRVLDSFVFAGDDRMVQDVWSAGRHLVKAGRHVGRDGIQTAYRRTMRRLRQDL